MNGLEGMLEVVDTGALVVDGVTLRRWGLSYLDAVGQPIGEMLCVTERLGYEGGFNILPGAASLLNMVSTSGATRMSRSSAMHRLGRTHARQ